MMVWTCPTFLGIQDLCDDIVGSLPLDGSQIINLDKSIITIDHKKTSRGRELT